MVCLVYQKMIYFIIEIHIHGRYTKTLELHLVYIWKKFKHMGSNKMAVICQQVVILLQLCTDMIDITLTFHLIPHIGHLEHMQLCCRVINAKAKFLPCGNSEFAFWGSFRKELLIGSEALSLLLTSYLSLWTDGSEKKHRDVCLRGGGGTFWPLWPTAYLFLCSVNAMLVPKILTNLKRLTNLLQVPHICVSEWGQHWFR